MFVEVLTLTSRTEFLDNNFLKLLVDFAAHTDSFGNRSGKRVPIGTLMFACLYLFSSQFGQWGFRQLELTESLCSC